MGIRFIFVTLLAISYVLPVAAAKKATTTQSVKTKNFEALPLKEVPSQKVQTVSATPLDKPLSNQLREKRQQLEMDTEERMNQELEKARLEDERIRGEKILSSSSFQPISAEPTIKSETSMTTKVEVEESTDSSNNFYVGLMGGALNYPQLSNLATINAAAGVSLGLALPANFWLEGSFLYSFQEPEINRFVSVEKEQIDHFGLTGSALYRWNLFFADWIVPVTGLAVTYTRRMTNGGDSTSNSLDGGLVVGADFPVFKTISLGLEYRYMTNMDYNRDNKPASQDVALQQLATGTEVKNIESMDYQLVFINTKITF